MRPQLSSIACFKPFPSFSYLIKEDCLLRLLQMAPTIASTWFLSLESEKLSISISNTFCRNSREKGTRNFASCLMNSARTESTKSVLYFRSWVDSFSYLLKSVTKYCMIFCSTKCEELSKLAYPLLNNLMSNCREDSKYCPSASEMKLKILADMCCSFSGSQVRSSCQQRDSRVCCGLGQESGGWSESEAVVICRDLVSSIQ